VPSSSSPNSATTPAIISRTQSSTNRGRRCAFSTTEPLVRALHQLVDLARHRVLDDLEQRRCLDLVRAVLGAADVQRAEAALVVRRDRDGVEDALDLGVGEAVGGERSRAWPATICCAHGHAVMPCAATPTSRRVPRSLATAEPYSV
jgi:hypothetical protein